MLVVSVGSSDDQYTVTEVVDEQNKDADDPLVGEVGKEDEEGG